MNEDTQVWVSFPVATQTANILATVDNQGLTMEKSLSLWVTGRKTYFNWWQPVVPENIEPIQRPARDPWHEWHRAVPCK
jgi:hypothetical protein